jgi:hypothetical protein
MMKVALPAFRKFASSIARAPALGLLPGLFFPAFLMPDFFL